jgi:hypothetical protein
MRWMVPVNWKTRKAWQTVCGNFVVQPKFPNEEIRSLRLKQV